MKKQIAVAAMLVLAIVSGSAEAAFTCEQIKDKKTRASCIDDRVEKEKAEIEEKEKAEIAAKENAVSEKRKDMDDFVRKSKEALTREFKDPAGAQFTDLAASENSSSRTLCGSVNGKNSYGAYIGYKRFTVEWFKSSKNGPIIWTEFQSTTEEQRNSDYPPMREHALKMISLEEKLRNIVCEPTTTQTVTKID